MCPPLQFLVRNIAEVGSHCPSITLVSSASSVDTRSCVRYTMLIVIICVFLESSSSYTAKCQAGFSADLSQDEGVVMGKVGWSWPPIRSNPKPLNWAGRYICTNNTTGSPNMYFLIHIIFKILFFYFFIFFPTMSSEVIAK